MKTVAQLIAELEASSSEYVTYGSSDLGLPVLRIDAIADIRGMDDSQIGEGTWYECNAAGEVAGAR